MMHPLVNQLCLSSIKTLRAAGITKTQATVYVPYRSYSQTYPLPVDSFLLVVVRDLTVKDKVLKLLGRATTDRAFNLLYQDELDAIEAEKQAEEKAKIPPTAFWLYRDGCDCTIGYGPHMRALAAQTADEAIEEVQNDEELDITEEIWIVPECAIIRLDPHNDLALLE